MFQRLCVRPENLAHLDRIEGLVRTRFAVPTNELVLVTEDPGLVPGHPPLLTTVRFWIAGERFRLRFFKSAAEVDMTDLPVAWLLRALVDDGEPDCC